MTETDIPKTGDTRHANLAQALAAFQAELPKLTKDEKAKVKGETKDGRAYDRSYGYADLAQVVETVLPVLGSHGLSITSATTLDEGQMVLVVTLLHESGELRTSYWPLPDLRRVGPQDIGSAMTYGRRYLTLALTGTYPGGEDDDGAKAQQAPRESWDSAVPARPATQQANRPVSAPPAEPAKPVKTSWTDTEVYDYQAKMGTVSLDSAIKAYDWMAGKNLHNRAVGHPTEADKPQMTATTVIAVKLATAAKEAEPADIDQMKAVAADRGLLKVPVSPDATLEQALFEARELAVHAAVEQAKADTPAPGEE
jgi:hypothetical protein